jgi:hypothetical protein
MSKSDLHEIMPREVAALLDWTFPSAEAKSIYEELFFQVAAAVDPKSSVN